MNKKWRSLIPLLCAQFIGLIGLGTSTFAWMITSSKASFDVESSSTSFSSTASEFGFSITDGTQAWTSGGSITVTEGTDKKLAPAAHETITSTVGERAQDPGRWYYKYADSASSSQSTGDKTYLTSSDFGQYVYAQDFYFKATDTIAGIMVDSVTLPDNKGISVLFEGPQGHIEYNQTTPLGYAEHINLVANVGPETIPDKPLESPYKVTAYIYIDGNNEYVKTANAQYISGDISFGFSIWSPEKHVYLQSKDNSFGANGALMYMYAWSTVNEDLYHNAKFPGVPMTKVRNSYHDSFEGQNVTLYEAPLNADDYDRVIFSGVNPSALPLPEDIHDYTSGMIWHQTTNIAASGDMNNMMAVLSNEKITETDERGAQKYGFTRWETYPSYLVTFKEKASDATGEIVAVPAGVAIPSTKWPTTPSKHGCNFIGWAPSTGSMGPDDVIDLQTHTFDADTTMVAVFSEPIIEEYTIYFQAKNYDPDWIEGDTYGASIYMWEDGTDNKNAPWPGVPMTPCTGMAGDNRGYKYYSATVSTQYTHFVIAKVLKGTTTEVEGHKWQTEDCEILRGTQENRFMWITNEHRDVTIDESTKSIYTIGGWLGYPEHLVTFKALENDDFVLKQVYVPSGSAVPQSELPANVHLRRYIFNGTWTLNGQPIDIATQTYDTDVTLYASFSEDAGMPLDTFDVYFEANSDWRANGNYGVRLYQYDSQDTGHSGNPRHSSTDLTNPTYISDLGADVYKGTLSNDYDSFVFIRYLKSSGEEISGEKYKTAPTTINKSLQNNKCFVLDSYQTNTDMYNRVYNVSNSNWKNYPIHTITIHDGSTTYTKLARHGETIFNGMPEHQVPDYGKKFSYWTLGGLGQGTQYTSLSGVTFSADTDVYANYTDLSTYTVYFEPGSDWTGPIMGYAEDSNGKNNYGFPGVALSAYSGAPAGRTYYEISVPNNVSKVVFSDSAKKQTTDICDISSRDGKLFYLTGTMTGKLYDWQVTELNYKLVTFADENNNVLKTMRVLPNYQVKSDDYSGITVPDKPMYVHNGWKVNGSKVEFPYTVTSDVTFKPSYINEITQINVYNGSTNTLHDMSWNASASQWEISGLHLNKGDKVKLKSNKFGWIEPSKAQFAYASDSDWRSMAPELDSSNNYTCKMTSDSYGFYYRPDDSKIYVAAQKDTLYLNASSNWLSDGAKLFLYVAYSDGTADSWIKMSHVIDNVYKAKLTKTDHISLFIWVRCNSSTPDSGGWSYKMNQSGDFSYGNSDYNNQFNMPDWWDTWTSDKGTWEAR